MALVFDNDASSIAGIVKADPGVNVLTIANTQGILLPSGTIAQRPVSPINGTMRTNTDLSVTEQYVNGVWQPIFQSGGRGYGCFFDDFLVDAGVASGARFGEGWTSSLTGTGASAVSNFAQVTSANDSVGVMELSTGTTTTGNAGISLSTGCFVLGYGQFFAEWRVMIPTLSTGAQQFDFYAGFLDTITGGDQTNGVYFQYNQASSTLWRACTASGSVRTKNNNTTVVAGTWYKLGILINAAASSVGFYINDTLVATNTTNIPTGAELTPAIGFGTKITKLLGTTARVVDIDYEQIIYTPTTVR